MTVAWLLLLLWQPVQQDIQSENLETFTVADRFQEALQTFNSVQQTESEAMFRTIVGELEEQRDLDEDERIILTESLKYLGQLTFPNETERFFTRLIQFDPGYQLNTKDMPPKIAAVFIELRDRLVGQIRVTATDAETGEALYDATLVVNGKVAGSIMGESLIPVLAGSWTVEIRKPNFESFRQDMTIPGNTEVMLQGQLTRNASQLYFVVSPPGVNVTINGEPQGQADHEVLPGYRRKLESMNLDFDKVGALAVNNLPMGEYTITFNSPCFKEKTSVLTIDQHKRWLLEPQSMEPSRALLSVSTASDASGIVFLDQERIGFLPVVNHPVCPGEYDLRVRFTDGEFIKRVELADSGSIDVLAEPLPSMIWFGIQSDEADEAPADVDSWLRSLDTWNVQSVDPDDITRVPVNPFPVLFGDENIPEDQQEFLTRHLKADLYVAGRIVRRKVVIRHLEIAFWSPLSRRIHVMSFRFQEIERLRKALDAIDTPPPLTDAWLGFRAGRMKDAPGLAVLSVHPNGPATDKLNIGARVTEVNGTLLKEARELTDRNDLEPVRLTADGQAVDITPVATIAEVPFQPNQVAPQAWLAKFDKLTKYHPDPLYRQSAQFNQARFQFFMGDFKEAFDAFSTMRIDMPYGINQGTLWYYQALCFRRLNLKVEAMNAFQEVLNYPNATLFDAYGPAAAFWAQTEMNNPNP